MRGVMKNFTESLTEDGLPWGTGEIMGADGNIYPFDITTFIRSGIGPYPLFDYMDTNANGDGTSVFFEVSRGKVVSIYPSVENW